MTQRSEPCGPRCTTVAGALDSVLNAPAAASCAPTLHRTGFTPLDDVISGGLRPGELVLIGGKPGRGKTVAALQWARALATSGVQAVYACFEHDVLSLLIRLLHLELAEVAHAAGEVDQLRLELIRGELQRVVLHPDRLRGLLQADPLLHEAARRVHRFGQHLKLIEANSATGDLAALDRLVADAQGPAVLFVDYLQKVPAPPGTGEHGAAEGLKSLALRHRIPVVAVVAAEQEGLAARRLRLHHFRGAAALAYEADTVIVLNDKLSIVSRSHLAYDTSRLHHFRDRVVFSVEKNRGGMADVDLEFRKDFSSFRFDPAGSWVSERLWEEGSVED